jgi:hypothetical protein
LVRLATVAVAAEEVAGAFERSAWIFWISSVGRTSPATGCSSRAVFAVPADTARLGATIRADKRDEERGQCEGR